MARRSGWWPDRPTCRNTPSGCISGWASGSARRRFASYGHRVRCWNCRRSRRGSCTKSPRTRRGSCANRCVRASNWGRTCRSLRWTTGRACSPPGCASPCRCRRSARGRPCWCCTRASRCRAIPRLRSFWTCAALPPIWRRPMPFSAATCSTTAPRSKRRCAC